MARIGAAGIETVTTAEYIERLRDLLREALGSDINFEPETPQSQIVGVLSLPFAEADELGAHVAAGMSLRTATGLQLDAWGSLLGVPRIPGTRSTVTVTLTGTSGTLVPQGSRVRTSAGAVFRLIAAANIPTAGTVDAAFESAEIGPVQAGADELTEIIDVVRGWSGATNAAAAVVGAAVESDAAYRLRYGRVLARSTAGTIEGMEAALRSVDGVEAAVAVENSTASRAAGRGVTTDAVGVSMVVIGGRDADVAASIAASKPVGVRTGTTQTVTGQTQVSVADPGGFSRNIRFYRAVNVATTVVVTTTKDPAIYPSDGDARIRAALVDLFSELDIGDTPNQFRMQAAVLTVPGHSLTSVVARRKSPDAALGTATLRERFTLADGDITT